MGTSYWHGSPLQWWTPIIHPVAPRWPHQTDNLLSWCILQRRCPASVPQRRARRRPHPSGAGRRPSSASAWRRPAEGRGYFWRAGSWDGRKTQTDLLSDTAWQHRGFQNYWGGFIERQRHLSPTACTHKPGLLCVQRKCRQPHPQRLYRPNCSVFGWKWNYNKHELNTTLLTTSKWRNNQLWRLILTFYQHPVFVQLLVSDTDITDTDMCVRGVNTL